MIEHEKNPKSQSAKPASEQLPQTEEANNNNGSEA